MVRVADDGLKAAFPAAPRSASSTPLLSITHLGDSCWLNQFRMTRSSLERVSPPWALADTARRPERRPRQALDQQSRPAHHSMIGSMATSWWRDIRCPQETPDTAIRPSRTPDIDRAIASARALVLSNLAPRPTSVPEHIFIPGNASGAGAGVSSSPWTDRLGRLVAGRTAGVVRGRHRHVPVPSEEPVHPDGILRLLRPHSEGGLIAFRLLAGILLTPLPAVHTPSSPQTCALAT
jgi:hypothetical protein